MLATIALVIATVALVPPVRARVKAAAVVADAMGLPLPRPFAATVDRREVAVGEGRADLYHPGRPAPPVLLLPGATPAGRDDGRIVQVAEAVAAAGRLVLVPELTLYEQRFDEYDLERIVVAGVELAQHPDARGDLVLVGFSYGGSFGLVAATDRRLAERLELVATFGAYFDLAGVIQAATTGVSVVDDRRIPWEPDPRAGEIIRDVAVDEAPTGQRASLLAALDGRRDPGTLLPEARAFYDLLLNEDPDRTPALIDALPEETQRRLARLSPAAVHYRLTVPLLVMHSTDDPAVPYAEAIRLGAAMPHVPVFRVEVFRHVDFRVGGIDRALTLPRDMVSVVRFAGRVLAAQE